MQGDPISIPFLVEPSETELENARVTREWDSFSKKYPHGSWEDLSEEGKQTAIKISERQSKRMWKLIDSWK